jgi:signal peptidase I
MAIKINSNDTKGMKLQIKKLLNFLIKIFFFILCAILLAIVLRISFGVFQISGLSMSPTLLPNEYILVNKLIPGPRYITNIFSLKKDEKIKIKRIINYKKIKRKDVLIFNKSSLVMDFNSYHIKRCLAIPGDTFFIENGFNKVKQIDEILGDYFCQQTLSKKLNTEFDNIVFNCFPHDTTYNWNIKDFGPLYIPKNGDTLFLDTLNTKLYSKVITHETDKLVVTKNGHILLGDSIITNYVFKKNYYFVIGDWVFDSNDSRYWGLLPEDHIIGKGVMILHSKDQNLKKHRWKKYFKIIK